MIPIVHCIVIEQISDEWFLVTDSLNKSVTRLSIFYQNGNQNSIHHFDVVNVIAEYP